MTLMHESPHNEQPQPVELTEELAQRTTKNLVGTFESVGLMVQGFALMHTGTIDKVTSTGSALIYGIAGAHLLAALVTFKVGGPFYRGEGWGGLWISVAFLMPLVMANLVPAGEYGASPACVQACGYPAPVIVFFAFYPWIIPKGDVIRPGLELFVLAALILEPLLLIWHINGSVNKTNMLSVTASTIPYIGAYILGKTLGTVCRKAAWAQLNALRAEYVRLFDYLHSQVETSLRVARIHYDHQQPNMVLKTLSELDQAVNGERISLTLAGTSPDVAEIFRLHMNRVRDVMTIRKPPRLGSLTVRRPVAIVLSQALGDLLKNALMHGGATVELDCTVDQQGGIDVIHLTVTDHGEGFSPSVLDDPATSLHALRQRARDLGGDLIMDRDYQAGAKLRLSVPLHNP